MPPSLSTPVNVSVTGIVVTAACAAAGAIARPKTEIARTSARRFKEPPALESPRTVPTYTRAGSSVNASPDSDSACFFQWLSSRRATTILWTSSGPSAMRSMRL